MSEEFINTDPRITMPIFKHRLLVNSTHLNKVFGKPEEDTLTPERDVTKAQLVTSKMIDRDLHMPVFDMDIPFDKFTLIESPSGNTHLFMNVPMSWEDLNILADAFEKVGLIDAKWRKHCEHHKMLRVRMPGVPKTKFQYSKE